MISLGKNKCKCFWGHKVSMMCVDELYKCVRCDIFVMYRFIVRGRTMFKKIFGVTVIICLLFLSFSCPSPGSGCISKTMEEWGYAVYFVCILVAIGGGEATIDTTTVGDVTTYTFNNYMYSPPATVNGTIVYDAGVFPETELGNLTFTNDPMGLTSIQTDMDWDGAHYSGTFTINGCDDPSPQAYQAYIESAGP
jgi:hypothetical protein